MFDAIKYFSNIDSSINTQFDNSEIEFQVLDFFTKEMEESALQGSQACRPFKNFHSFQDKYTNNNEFFNSDLFHPMPSGDLPFTDQVVQFQQAFQNNENIRVQITIYLRQLNSHAQMSSENAFNSIFEDYSECLQYFRAQSSSTLNVSQAQSKQDICKLDQQHSTSWGPKKLIMFGLLFCLRPMILTILYAVKVSDPINLHLFQSYKIDQSSASKQKQVNESPLICDPITNVINEFGGYYFFYELIDGIYNFLMLDECYKPDISYSIYQYILEFIMIIPPILDQYSQVFSWKQDNQIYKEINDKINKILEKTKSLTQFATSGYLEQYNDENDLLYNFPSNTIISLQELYSKVSCAKNGNYEELNLFFEQILMNQIKQQQKSIPNSISYILGLRMCLDEEYPNQLDQYLEQSILKVFGQTNPRISFYLSEQFLSSFQPFSLRYVNTVFKFAEFVYSKDIYELTNNQKAIAASRQGIALALKNYQQDLQETTVQKHLIDDIKSISSDLKKSQLDISIQTFSHLLKFYIQLIEQKIILSQQELQYYDDENLSSLTIGDQLESIIGTEEFNLQLVSLFSKFELLHTEKDFQKQQKYKIMQVNILQKQLKDITILVNTSIPEIQQFWQLDISNIECPQLNITNELDKFYLGQSSEYDSFGHIYINILQESKTCVSQAIIVDEYVIINKAVLDVTITNKQFTLNNFAFLQELEQQDKYNVVIKIYPIYKVKVDQYLLPIAFKQNQNYTYNVIQPNVNQLRELSFTYQETGQCSLNNQSCNACQFKGIQHFNFISGRFNQYLHNWEEFYSQFFIHQTQKDIIIQSLDMLQFNFVDDDIIVSDFTSLLYLFKYNYQGDLQVAFTQIAIVLLRKNLIRNTKASATYVNNIIKGYDGDKLFEFLTKIISHYYENDKENVLIQKLMSLIGNVSPFNINSKVLVFDKFSFQKFVRNQYTVIYRIIDQHGVGINLIPGVRNIFVKNSVIQNQQVVSIKFKSELKLSQVCQILYLNYNRIIDLVSNQSDIVFTKECVNVKVNDILVSSMSLSPFVKAEFKNNLLVVYIEQNQIEVFINYIMQQKLIQQSIFQTVNRMFPNNLKKNCLNNRFVIVSNHILQFLQSSESIFVQKSEDYKLDIADQILRLKGDKEFSPIHNTYIKPSSQEKVEKQLKSQLELIQEILKYYSIKLPEYQIIKKLIALLETGEFDNLLDYYPQLAVSKVIWDKMTHTDDDFIIEIE
eukprot:EST47619.1 Hypothetical protein SS50377_12314 [Spironucleus salmonicida]